MADNRTLDAITRFESDVLILDYLVYTATSKILRIVARRVDHETSKQGISDQVLAQLQLVDGKFP